MRRTHWKLPRGTFVFERAPALMTIVNVTPDSFSDGGQFFELDHAWARCQQALEDGARILDIGGESTRPGAERVSTDEEKRRVLPLIQRIRQHSDAIISVDTTNAAVAEAAMGEGADIINDISGLRFDPRMAEIAAKTRAGLILMHVRGDRDTMHDTYEYDDIGEEVWAQLDAQRALALDAGIDDDAILYDLGFGFSKDVAQNLALYRALPQLLQRDRGVLVGISRKRMVRASTGAELDALDHGSSVLHAEAARHGAQVLRVHNTRAAAAAIAMALALHA